MSKSFSATVTEGGHGSALTIDGLDMSDKVSGFGLTVSVEGVSRLDVQMAYGFQGCVTGTVDSVVWRSRVWVVCDGDVGPIGVYGSQRSAELACSEWNRRHGDDYPATVKETDLELTQ